MFGRSQRLVLNYFSAMFEIAIKQQRAAEQEDEWTKPKQVRGRFHWRFIQDKIAVALRQESDDLLIAFARFHLFANFLAQVFGEIGPRIAQRLVLTNQPAHLLRQSLHTLL